MIKLRTAIYPQYYNDYYKHLPDDMDVLQYLRKQQAEVALRLSEIPADKEAYAYAPGKWTVKELVGHCADVERVFAYRMLCIARADKSNFPGFEEDDYVKQAQFNRRSLASLAAELNAVREATLCLAESLTETDLAQVGNANMREVSAEAILYVIPAHLAHHLRILSERYGLG